MKHKTPSDMDKLLTGMDAPAVPLESRTFVTLLNRSKSPINFLDKHKVLTGYTLLPGIVTPDIPRDAWDNIKTLPAVKAMLEEETIIAVDRHQDNLDPELLVRKVTDPQMPEDLQGKQQSMGQRSSVNAPVEKEAGGITLTEKE
jgi:hypothetical protein